MATNHPLRVMREVLEERAFKYECELEGSADGIGMRELAARLEEINYVLGCLGIIEPIIYEKCGYSESDTCDIPEDD